MTNTAPNGSNHRNDSFDLDLSIERFANTSIEHHENIVAVEVPESYEKTTTLFFTNFMWQNMNNIMRHRTGTILAAVGDRISEINCSMDLFSNKWFRGKSPISIQSMIWDFKNHSNDGDVCQTDSTETDTLVATSVSPNSTENESLQDTLNDSLNATSCSLNSQTNDETGTEYSNFYETLSDEVLNANLIALYQKEEKNEKND